MTDSNFHTITTTAENIVDLIRVTEDTITEAGQQRDPDLTPEANARKAEERKEKIRADAVDWLGRKSGAAELATTKAETALRKIRPSIDDNNVAALVRAEQRWNHHVKPLLDSGQTLKDVLRNASLDDLLAIERFSGGWLTAQRATVDNPLELDPQNLEQSIMNRMSAVLPPEQREAFEDAVRARHAGQMFKEVQELALQAVSGQAAAPLSNWGQAKSKVMRIR